MGDLILLEDASRILQSKDLPDEYVDVPEWGGRVRVVALSGVERDKFESSLMNETKDDSGAVIEREVVTDNMRAKLVAASVRKADGSRVFSDAQVVALGKKSAKALDRIFRTSQRLSGLSDDDVKELTEGLKADPSEGSGSA